MNINDVTSFSSVTIKMVRFALVEGNREEVERILLNLAKRQVERMISTADWENADAVRFAAYVNEVGERRYPRAK